LIQPFLLLLPKLEIYILYSMVEQKSSTKFFEELDQKLSDMQWPVIMPFSFDKVLNSDKNIAIIDVREKNDCCFTDDRINKKQIINIPFNSFVNQINTYNLESYDMIILVCFAGPKGAVAASIMRWMGYDNAFFLKGGVEEFSLLETVVN